MVIAATRVGQGVIVARMRRRVAAGAAMFAAVVTVGGPGIAAAPADPGRSGSHRGDGGGNRGGDGGRHGGGSRNDSRNGDQRGRTDRDRRDGRDERGERRRHGGYGGKGDGGRRNDHGSKGGGGRGDSDWDDDDSSSGAAPRGTSTAVASLSVAAESESVGAESIDTSSTGGGTTFVTPPVVVPAGGGGAVPGDVPAAIERPTVRFGNGRTPGLLSSGRPGAEIPAEAPGRAVPAAPEAAIAPIVLPPTPPTGLPNVGAESKLPWIVSEAWSPIGPGDNSGALFGLAGLLLIPLAGVWLGYRQAMAARAAASLSER
jgi:hypothetical protein